MIQTSTLDEIYRIFLKTYPLDKLSFTQFKLYKPWNLVKAYRETCLCRMCEVFRLYVQGLNAVSKLLTSLVNTSSDGTTAADEADDEYIAADTATTREEAADPCLLELVKFCCLESKSEIADALVCGGFLTNNSSTKKECITGSCSNCGFKRLWSQGLRPKLVDSDANGAIRDGVSPVWSQQVRWETLKSSGSAPDSAFSDEKETLRAQRVGTVIQFLDAFETASVQFPAHRHLVWDAKVKAHQRDRYCWPGMLLSDYDWSENGIITPSRQIQSEYWSLTHYSLFISITTHLVVEAWMNRRSLLNVKAEVTVEPQGAPSGSMQPAKGSYWARVHSSPAVEGEEEIYSVEREDGSVVGGITRERLRHRKKSTTAFICVTDEKRHDAATTQHFLNRQFQHWLQHVDRGKFWAWLGHSDNASHFKSSAMMHYWAGRISEVGFLKSCWIEFGCPGHGKGPWDGMGAVMKQQLKRDMTNGKILTSSGYVTCPREVAEHLRARFETEEWIMAHADKSIQQIVVTYSHHDEVIERPRVEHEFEPLTGKMSSFSFIILARDQIGRRERSCWCEPCFHQRARETLMPRGNGTLVCEECRSPIPLPWYEQSVKDLGTGLAGRRKEAQGLGAQLAPRLKAGGFLAVQARQRWSISEDLLYRPGHFWVAQAPDVLQVRKITKRETISGQPFSPGDYLIHIGRYFERDAMDMTGLTFEEWQPELVFTPLDVCKLCLCVTRPSFSRDPYIYAGLEHCCFSIS